MKKFLYRFFVLLLAYALIAIVVLESIATVVESWLFWTIFGVVIGMFFVILVTEELIRFFKKKNG